MARDSKGCGGVMRIAPVGLARVGSDAFELGCDIAAIKHGHPSGYLAAGALAELIARICDNLTLDKALDRVQGVVRRRWRHEEVLDALVAARALAASDAAPGPETIATLGAGWVAEEALAISVDCALLARDFAHGVLLAVNHSGDSDSTGAITGNILGACSDTPRSRPRGSKGSSSGTPSRGCPVTSSSSSSIGRQTTPPRSDSEEWRR